MQAAPKREGSITAFAVLNLFFASSLGIGVLIAAAAMVYGVFFSGDPANEVFTGVLGGVVVLGVLFMLLAVYILAGIGLFKVRKWGYYFHLAGALLAAFSCIGIAYTIPAFAFALRDEFRCPFFDEVETVPVASRVKGA